MQIKPIKTKQDYDQALLRMQEVFDAIPGTPDGDEAEILALLIENYETRQFPIDPPDPIEAIRIRMEEMNLPQSDLAKEIGGKNRVSEILNRKRKLTLEMVRNLASRLHIASEILIRDYPLNK